MLDMEDIAIPPQNRPHLPALDSNITQTRQPKCPIILLILLEPLPRLERDIRQRKLPYVTRITRANASQEPWHRVDVIRIASAMEIEDFALHELEGVLSVEELEAFEGELAAHTERIERCRPCCLCRGSISASPGKMVWSLMGEVRRWERIMRRISGGRGEEGEGRGGFGRDGALAARW